jgi:shikimate dehydrogenase
MGGESLPRAVLDQAAGFFDLTYGPAVSPAIRYARERAIPCADGKELLIAQAAASFEIWTGMPAPVDVMRAAF